MFYSGYTFFPLQAFIDEELADAAYKKTFADIATANDYWNWLRTVMLPGSARDTFNKLFKRALMLLPPACRYRV